MESLNDSTNTEGEGTIVYTYAYNILNISGPFQPLNFWFNQPKTPSQSLDEFILTQPNGKTILDQLDHYTEITDINTLSKLKDDIDEMKYLYRRNVQGVQFYHSFVPDPDLKLINERIELLSNCDYNPLITFDCEEINGYQLKTDEFSVYYDVYLEWKGIWDDNEEMTYDIFKSKFENIACSDWAKMDKHGVCYGGYWKYPEGSEERENAWELSYNENCRALYDLPYPKNFILHTVKVGCNNRLESVPYTNLLCEYMKRQIDIMNQPKSLKNLCAKIIIQNKLNYKKLPNDLIEEYGFNKLYKFNTLKTLTESCVKTIIKNKLDYYRLPKDLIDKYEFDKHYKVPVKRIDFDFSTLYPSILKEFNITDLTEIKIDL